MFIMPTSVAKVWQSKCPLFFLNGCLKVISSSSRQSEIIVLWELVALGLFHVRGNSTQTQIPFEGPSLPSLQSGWLQNCSIFFAPAGFISHRVNSPETLVKGGVRSALWRQFIMTFWHFSDGRPPQGRADERAQGCVKNHIPFAGDIQKVGSHNLGPAL